MVSTKAHLNQHDNNQCKYRKDDHKNFLPHDSVLYICKRICFFCFVLQFIQVITWGEKKIPELAIQSGQYRKKKQLTTTIKKRKKQLQ